MSQPLHDILNPFVGRKQEQQLYQRMLTQANPWVLIITAQGGNGKSTLLSHLVAQTPHNISIALLNFANESLRSDSLKILAELSWKFASSCNAQRVNAFKKTLQESHNRLSELSRQMSQTIHVEKEANLHGAHLSMSSSDAATLRVQYHHVRETVTEALYAQLLTFSPKQLVIMLDTCEWLSEPEGLEVGQWVMNEQLPGIHERMIQRHRQCSVVIASRMPLTLTVIQKQDCYPLTLPMLEQAAVDDYLKTIGMQDTMLRQRVYDITHGHALCVSIIGILWQEQGDQPLALADLPQLQKKFSEQALLEFIQERLDKRLKTPFRELTRYGVLLRSFNLPMLQAVFPELLLEAGALDIFHQLLRYPYIESRGNQHYAIHDLLREIQAVDIEEQQPGKWREYHKRALDYFTQTAFHSPDWYYHAIAYDEEQGISHWWDAVQTARNRGERDNCALLLQAAGDGILRLSMSASAQLAFQVGRFYYNWLDIEAALASYEQALTLFRQVGDRLGEANVRKAMGNLALEQEEFEKALILHNTAYQLYQQIEDRYSQAVLLYYRSFVFEATNERRLATHDMKLALTITQSLDLPFVEIFQKRLAELEQ
ncbi:MAG: hypothetical protein NVS4B7_01520 [Ktedonobacteraceae bacterium]